MLANNERTPAMEQCLYEATEYNVVARRNLLLGLSVGRSLGLAPEDLDSFAAEVIAADHREPGHDDVLEMLSASLAGRGRPADPHELRRLLMEAQRAAHSQFAATD